MNFTGSVPLISPTTPSRYVMIRRLSLLPQLLRNVVHNWLRTAGTLHPEKPLASSLSMPMFRWALINRMQRGLRKFVKLVSSIMTMNHRLIAMYT